MATTKVVSKLLVVEILGWRIDHVKDRNFVRLIYIIIRDKSWNSYKKIGDKSGILTLESRNFHTVVCNFAFQLK